MEAPIGIEPMNNGFAIRSLSHLGTAPRENPARNRDSLKHEASPFSK